MTAGIQQAQSLLGNQDFIAAEKLLRPLAEKFSDKPGPTYLLGYSLHGLKRYDEARAMYGKAKSFPQVRINCLYNIACTWSLQNKTDEAIAALDEAILAGFANFGQMQVDPDFKNIRDDARFKKLIPVWLADDELFVEPVRIIGKWTGEAPGDQFGWTARIVGDLDGDGKTDFVTTAPTHNGGAGKIYVYSSGSGKLIHQVTGQPGEGLGNSAVGIGDLIIGAWQNRQGAPSGGKCYLYSLADGGKLLRTFTCKQSGDTFGFDACGIGEVDGDGKVDFLLTSAWSNNPGPKTGRVFIVAGE